MKTLSILIFLLPITSGFCQMKEATIFFNDSTSILGLGEIKNNKIYFKVEPKDDSSEWSYDMASALIYSGYGYSEKYQYVKINNHLAPQLLEVVDEGNVTLYKQIQIPNSFLNTVSNGYFTPNGSYIPGTSGNLEDSEVQYKYFVKRKNEKLATIIHFNFKEKMLDYFSDCPILKKKIVQKIYTKKNIEEMINYYNNYCNDDQEN
jgi:hypothetical protein